MTNQKIFLVTGVSSGFGRAFADAAFSAGHLVVGTVREERARKQFESEHPDLAKAILLDVTDFDAIDPKIAEIEKTIGPVSVLVNNAGYGHEGTIEESPLAELRRQFDVNVFGAVAMIKAVLPFMRRRRSGHIINITSMGGYITLPGIAYYCGSKFALEAISETLSKEVRDFGIRVTAVAPGQFRTDWAGRSMIRSERTISDYDNLMNPIRKARQDKSGRQPGDPAKAAQVLLKIVEHQDPPTHLLLGNDALKLVREKLENLSAEFAFWEETTCSTGFDTISAV
ncbi:MAG TPA: oxidoreductase [Chthoniobacterales bacterium]|jgi:NAD(P)-dependent dehydrogenase (short-subunit alcohol dehydrogenase family)|nr:oxidoreductase [Chthoniobacterales bacterium]